MEITPNEKGSENEEVNGSIITTTFPPATPSLGPEHWSEIMARFDSFEKTIQTTIKEEIKVNTIGVQNQVKRLNTAVKEVENKI